MSVPTPIVNLMEYPAPSPSEDHMRAVLTAERGGAVKPVHRPIGNLVIPYDLLAGLETEVATMDPPYETFLPLKAEQSSLTDSDTRKLYAYEKARNRAIPPLVRELISVSAPLFYATVFKHSEPLRRLYKNTHTPGLSLIIGPYRYQDYNAPHRDTAGGVGTVSYTATLLGPPTVFQTTPFKESDFEGEILRGPLLEPKSYSKGTIIMHDGMYTPHAAPDPSYSGVPRIFLQTEFSRGILTGLDQQP